MSGSSLDSSLGTTELTPSSLHSMEEVQFPARHLLADLSPSQLDRNFSESPNTSNRFSGNPSGDRSSNTPLPLLVIMIVIPLSITKLFVLRK